MAAVYNGDVTPLFKVQGTLSAANISGAAAPQNLIAVDTTNLVIPLVGGVRVSSGVTIETFASPYTV